MIFKKKKKPEWELERIYHLAIDRLTAMEENEETFATLSEEEEELLAAVEFNTKRLQALGSDDKTEFARIKANIDVAKMRIEVMSKKNTLEDQRRYVERLAEMRKDWEESQRRRKLSPDSKMAATVTICAAAAPYMIERCGKLAQHLKGKVPLPRIWK